MLKIRFKNWLVILNVTVINFILGSVYAWSEVKVHMIQLYGWSMGSLKPPFTVMIVMFVTATLIGGRIQQKIKPDLISISGAILFGTGFILTGLFPGFNTVVISFGIITGIGMGLCFSITIPSALRNLNNKNTGLVIGLVVSGIGLAPLYMDLLTNLLLEIFSVKYTFVVFGAFNMVSIILLSVHLRIAGNKNLEYDSKIKHSEKKTIDIKWISLIRNRYFQVLWIIQLLVTFASLLVIGCLGSVAKVQISWKAGFVLVIIVSISNFFGRILTGILSDYINYRKLLFTVILLQVLNIILFWSYSNILLMVMGIAITGLTFGCFFTIFPIAILKNFGKVNFGFHFGILMTAWGAAVIFNSFLFRRFVIPVGTLNIPHLIALLYLFISLYMLRYLKQP